MRKKDLLWILFTFLCWRVFLYIFSVLGVQVVENQLNFLGGGLEKYLENPLFWGWANFDGEHYLQIAKDGYAPLLYFYFPLYPLLTNILSINKDLYSLTQIALLISHVSFFIALTGLWKLLVIDYKESTVKLILVSLIFFPTSFYFAANYTESLFLATVVWSFYFIRTNKPFLSGVFGALSSAIRIVGLALIPAFIAERYYQSRKKENLIFILFTSIGFVLYLAFLWKTTGNIFEFNKGSELFGEYRSQEPLLLPKVFYRYVFKIIPNLTWSYLPTTFTTLLEFYSGITLTIVAILGFFKLRFSYWLFLIAGFVMPTMYNGFVSLPRYALVLFPLFIYIGLELKNKNKLIKVVYFSVNIIALCVATILFIRGYWVS